MDNVINPDLTSGQKEELDKLGRALNKIDYRIVVMICARLLLFHAPNEKYQLLRQMINLTRENK